MYQVEKTWQSEGFDTDCHDQTDYYQIYYVLFGCLPADNMHPYDYDELHARLADLIESEPERTCRMVEVKTGEVADYRDTDEVIFHCESCHTERGIFSYDEDGNVYPARPEYCPNCGAKVVEDV